MVIVYFTLLAFSIIFFGIGLAISKREKIYNENVSNSRKFENMNKNVTNFDAEELESEIDDFSEPVIVESSLVSESLEEEF